ncbi:unnamed protein product [Chondrus crispus]|uniref:Uncharacterized protein n=1 Tax=Chondrus crispus TaxID=2769 RepID=R7QJF0_CHOCR|nr:unnamed protein product [Chondrus crispus]CDF37520.1 unnamed protein product [Chondrus crispus]|eukprot:XP_005717391.1 unnamed protein product [Chondrus crispus]
MFNIGSITVAALFSGFLGANPQSRPPLLRIPFRARSIATCNFPMCAILPIRKLYVYVHIQYTSKGALYLYHTGTLVCKSRAHAFPTLSSCRSLISQVIFRLFSKLRLNCSSCLCSSIAAKRLVAISQTRTPTQASGTLAHGHNFSSRFNMSPT